MIKTRRQQSALKLIQRMASVHYVAPGGETPLTYAAWFGCEHLIGPLLSKGALIDHRTRGNNTALSYSIIQGNLLIIKQLMDAGADLNTQDKHGYTPLMKAAGFGRARAAAYLLKKGARADLLDHYGLSAVNHLIRGEHYHLLPLFRGTNVPLDNKDGMGDTPLFYAVKKDCGPCVRFLLRGGAWVNARNIFGETALMHAVYLNKTNPLRQLLRAGASTTIKDHYGAYDAGVLARNSPRIKRILRRFSKSGKRGR